MIEQADERLRAWVGEQLEAVEVDFAPPGTARPGRGVSLYLLELVDAPPARGAGPTPLQLSLRYLVTTWAEHPQEAHRLLGTLAFAALERAEFEVEFAPVPLAAWTAFGTMPQPAFALRVPLRLERPQPEVPRVRGPLVVRSTPLGDLAGVVLGPGDRPIAGVQVELPVARRTVRTDARGRFAFAGVPVGADDRLLRVHTGGRTFEVLAEELAADREALTIRIDPLGPEAGRVPDAD